MFVRVCFAFALSFLSSILADVVGRETREYAVLGHAAFEPKLAVFAVVVGRGRLYAEKEPFCEKEETRHRVGRRRRRRRRRGERGRARPSNDLGRLGGWQHGVDKADDEQRVERGVGERQRQD